jgi:hypothetical protein
MREIIEYLLEEGIASDYESAVVIEMNLGDRMRCMIQRNLTLRPCEENPYCEPSEKKPIKLKIKKCKMEGAEGGSPYREWRPKPEDKKKPTKPEEGFDEFRKRWGIKRV